MFEQLILLGFGVVAICAVIVMASLIVWVWDRWEERQDRKARYTLRESDQHCLVATRSQDEKEAA